MTRSIWRMEWIQYKMDEILRGFYYPNPKSRMANMWLHRANMNVSGKMVSELYFHF